MKKASKFGAVVIILVAVVALGTLRVIGLEPQNLDATELPNYHNIARPGLWLRGQAVTTRVTDWSFVNALRDTTGNPEVRTKGPDGKERVTSVVHLYRLYQRNVGEF